MRDIQTKSAIYNNCYYALHSKVNYSKNQLILLCIHGIGESSLCFKEAINSELLKLVTIITPDLPGFGASCHADISFEQSSYMKVVINFLMAILEEEKIQSKNIVLLSHSAGNIIALNLIPYIQKYLVSYIDLDGLYDQEMWRYSSHVSQYESPKEFYLQAKKALLNEIEKAPSEYLLRYYSSLIRCNFQAFYNYAKESQNFLASKINYIPLAKEKHLFISSMKINKMIDSLLMSSGIQTMKMENLSHWLMIEEPEKIYGLMIEWIINCKNQLATINEFT